MTDTYGHTLNSGKKYFPGKYLQKVQSRNQIESSCCLLLLLLLLLLLFNVEIKILAITQKIAN